MVGLYEQYGQTFRIRFRREAEDNYEVMRMDIEPTHFFRRATWMGLDPAERRLKVKAAMVPPMAALDLEFGQGVNEDDVQLSCETNDEGFELLAVTWLDKAVARPGRLTIANVSEEMFHVLRAGFETMQAVEANEAGEEHLCIFCGDEGATVRTEGFAPECDECAGVSESLAPEGWQSCRKCGCWELNACVDDEEGPCSWAEEDLCSQCKEA